MANNWDDVQGPKEGELAIDTLAPDSDLHRFTIEKLRSRLAASERSMTKFYPRWRMNEARFQAYVDLPEYERILKDARAKKTPPEITSIVVPYSYATIWTIVTYMIHTFGGRKPIFQVGALNKDSVEPAKRMETMLQMNADHMRLVSAFFQWFLDGEVYGVGVVRNLWRKEWANRTSMQKGSIAGLAAPGLAPQEMKTRTRKMVYEGNDLINVDPFMFFPDPSVPMNQVNRRGEFAFWRTFEGRHTLKKEAAAGNLKHVEAALKSGRQPGYSTEGTNESQRNLLSQGTANPGDPLLQTDPNLDPYVQFDQGTIWIVPKDWKLGDREEPELWIFGIVNKTQIVQAEPLDLDHNRHPISVIEPGSFGYGFGQVGTADMLGPIQDALSWFINSHIYNVRSSLNNMFIVDPSMVELQDLKNPSPGKIIRLKRAALGQDIRSFFQQLQVQDVTSGHIDKMQSFMRMGDALSAINDNLRGIQEAGGRKTATEVRTSGEAGASRLAARARYISSQGVVDLAEQMCLNIQQNQSMEYYLRIVGNEASADPVEIKPEGVLGDFQFPVHDGTLPLDRVALLDVWKEIFLSIATNQQLSQQYDAGKIFEYVAELGGARNLSNFKLGPPGGMPQAQVSVRPDEEVARAAEAGNAVPI